MLRLIRNRHLRQCGCETLKPGDASRKQAFYQWHLSWRRALNTADCFCEDLNLITKIIAGIQFKNGIITKAENHQRIAA
jgi:hypothetical protein